jgi:hypothetical protein
MYTAAAFMLQQRATLYKFMGITTQDFTVFACSWYSLIRIDDEITGFRK